MLSSSFSIIDCFAQIQILADNMLLLAPRFSISRSLCIRQVRTARIQLRSVTPVATRALSLTAPKRDNCLTPPSSIERLTSSNPEFLTISSDSDIKKIAHEEVMNMMELYKAEDARLKRIHEGSASIHNENASFFRTIGWALGVVSVALMVLNLLVVVEKVVEKSTESLAVMKYMVEEMKGKMQKEVRKGAKRQMNDHVASLHLREKRARVFAGISKVMGWILRCVVDMVYTATSAALTLAFIAGCSKVTKGIIHQLEIVKALRAVTIIQ